MPRCGAHLTQADVARVFRAARQAGAVAVEVQPDGTILVHLSPRLTAQRNGNAEETPTEDEVIV